MTCRPLGGDPPVAGEQWMSDLDEGGLQRAEGGAPPDPPAGVVVSRLSGAELEEIIEAGSDWLWQTDAARAIAGCRIHSSR